MTLSYLFAETIIDLRTGEPITKATEFGPTFGTFSRGFIFIASIATFAYMVWGAFDWILAGGDSGKIESAKKKITQAIIGLTILMSVAAIFLLLQYFLGIDVMTAENGTGSQLPSNPGGQLPRVTISF